MKTICILTQSHLCRNPRVVKEANTLAEAGFNVTILTTFTYADLLEEDLKLIDTSKIKFKGIINMIPGQASKWYRLKQRLVRRLAGEAIGRFGWENILTLGYDYRKNLKAAIRENANLYTCHQEMSTVIGCKLIKRGFKVAFDFEDWYSHDLLPEANKTRPIKLLEKYEKFALKNSVLNYTTSESMAAGFAAFAGVEPHKVLHNVFPFAERDLLDGQFKDRTDLSRPSMHWYSQTIGPGRGLEFLVKSLDKVNTPVQLHLRGNCSEDFKTELTLIFPAEKGHQLFFHSLVPHKELLSRIAEHDIGLATEEYRPDSRNLTITNKILQYLLGGIAVIASDTAGQKEVAAVVPDAVFLFKNYNSDDLSSKINALIGDKATLEKAKKSALAIATSKYCWEQQEKWLVGWVNEVI
jgi:glycosyltransferase involved in cell wall biosynthesis